MRKPKAALVALLVTGALVGGCATGDDAGVVGPETFEFVSPDGQIEIHYDPPAERKPVATLTGPDLLDPDRTLTVQEDFAGEVVIA